MGVAVAGVGTTRTRLPVAHRCGLGKATDFGDPPGWIFAGYRRELLEADHVSCDKVTVHPAPRDQQVNDPVHECDIPPDPQLKVQVRTLSHSGRSTRIGDDDTSAALLFRRQHALSEDGLHFDNIVAVEAQQVGLIDIDIGGNGAVDAEIGHQSGGGRCRTQAGVAVDVG